jgi:hypothetical protein
VCEQAIRDPSTLLSSSVATGETCQGWNMLTHDMEETGQRGVVRKEGNTEKVTNQEWARGIL